MGNLAEDLTNEINLTASFSLQKFQKNMVLRNLLIFLHAQCTDLTHKKNI